MNNEMQTIKQNLVVKSNIFFFKIYFLHYALIVRSDKRDLCLVTNTPNWVLKVIFLISRPIFHTIRKRENLKHSRERLYEIFSRL